MCACECVYVRVCRFAALDYMLDMQGKVLKQIHRFVDDALATGDCVLINSGDGNSRACCVMVGYFVAKFGWSVGKALEFVRSRRPEVSPKPLYLKQLQVSAKGLGYVGEFAPVQVPLPTLSELGVG